MMHGYVIRVNTRQTFCFDVRNGASRSGSRTIYAWFRGQSTTGKI